MNSDRGQLGLQLLLVGALAALLAACGGGSSRGGGTSTTPLSITISALSGGVTGQSYSQTLQASGGRGTRTWSLSSGSLPDGLSLNSSTGAITGTPTTVGTFNFTVQVQDSSSPPQTATRALSITIADPLTITTTTLPNASEDDASYPATVQASGGIGPFAWSIPPADLPGGLIPDGSTTDTLGFTGDPDSGGSFTFTVQVTDSLNPPQTASQAYTVLILEITTTGLPDGVENDSYNASFSVIGEVGSVTWSEPTGSFDEVTGNGTTATPCEGLTLDFAAGTITGTPANPGTCGPFTMQGTDSDTPPRTDAQVLSINIIAELQITTTSLPDSTTGTAYNEMLSATGGTPPFTWSESTASFDDTTGQGAVSTACEGLALDFSAGTITGTPVNPGTCGPFTIGVDDSASPAQFDEQSLTVTVNPGPLIITTTSLPSGAVNRSYTTTLETSGGTPPFTWSEPTAFFDDSTGAGTGFCGGLTLSFTDGTITGTPTTEGTCGTFTIRVDDSGAPPQNATQDLSIVIDPEPVGGRNDTVADATPLTTNGDLTISASISPFADPSSAGPDNDFYRLTATVPADVVIEITAQRLTPTPSPLDSVIEIVDDDGTPLGSRFLVTCRDEGTVSGVDGSPDPTPNDFDDDCVNDDIELGVNRDSKLTFRVPGTTGDVVTFFVRVLEIRGDARPDFVYQLRIINAD